MNVILTGDDATKFEDWTIIEPQNDQINIKPRDVKSYFTKTCEIVQIYYNYVIIINGTKRFGGYLMLEFKITEGIAELTYNVNKDTNLERTIEGWKPRNELVHLIEKRSDLHTATKPESK